MSSNMCANIPLKKKLNTSDDDFASPVMFQKVKQKLSNVDTKVKSRKTRKKQITLDQIVRANFQCADVNPEDLQMALALSKSDLETSVSHNENESFSSTFGFHKQEKPRTLLEFGFKTDKKVLTYSGIRKKEPTKKSKFRFITPILLNRTEDERQSLISSKLSIIISQQQRENCIECHQYSEYSVVSDELKKLKCSECSIFRASFKSEQSFYIPDLNIVDSNAKCGVLLKNWKTIPCRENTPDRFTHEASSKLIDEDIIEDNIITSNYCNKKELTKSQKYINIDKEVNTQLGSESIVDNDEIPSPTISTIGDIEMCSIDYKSRNAHHIGSSSPDLFDDGSNEKMNETLTDTVLRKILDFSPDKSNKEFNLSNDCSSVRRNLLSCYLLESSNEFKDIQQEIHSINPENSKQEAWMTELSNIAAVYLNEEKITKQDADMYKNEVRKTNTSQLSQLSHHNLNTNQIENICESIYEKFNAGNISEPKTEEVEDVHKMKSNICIESAEEDFEFNDIEETSLMNNDIRSSRKYSTRDSCSLNVTEHIKEILADSYNNINSLHMSNEDLEQRHTDENKLLSEKAKEPNIKIKNLNKTNDEVNIEREFKQTNKLYDTVNISEELFNHQNHMETVEKKKMQSIRPNSLEDAYISDEEIGCMETEQNKKLQSISRNSFEGFVCTSDEERECTSGTVKNYKKSESLKKVVATEKHKIQSISPVSLEEIVYISDEEIECPMDDNEKAESLEKFAPIESHNHKIEMLNDLHSECCTPIRRFSSFSASSEKKIPFTRNKSEPNITPTNKFTIKTSNITPLTDYNQLSTPELMKKLDTFGLKPVKRKRGVNLLKHIYDATHPLLESSKMIENENQEIAKKMRKSESIEDLQTTQNKGNTPASDKNLNPWVGNISQEDVIFEKHGKSKVPTCQIPLQIVWHNFLQDHPEIVENILCYEPLHIDVIRNMLKEQGFKFQLQDLITFFDQKCITIRVTQN